MSQTYGKNILVPQLGPPISVPDSDRPIIIPPKPSRPIEIDKPPPSEPEFPVREPDIQPTPQVVKVTINKVDTLR